MSNLNEEHKNIPQEGSVDPSEEKDVLKSRVEFEKTTVDVLTRYLTRVFGSFLFLCASTLFIIGWIFLNAGLISSIPQFDPYPFTLLMMMVSFFSIFISMIVLMTQSRQEKIDQVRHHIDLEIDVRAEHEVTKILHMLDELRESLGIAKKEDKELEQMKEKIDIVEIKEGIEQVIESEEKE